MPNKYKLIYFNFKGRAELPRLMFEEAGVKFEDFRFEFQDWPSYKPKTPFGQVPVLEINGTPLPQSGAIVRYLAKELKLDGETDLESAYADMVYETLMDALYKYPRFEKDEKKKKELEATFYENHIGPTLQRFEEKFSEKVERYKKEKKTDKCFFLGKKLTYADLAIMNSANELEGLKKGFMDSYPYLKALVERTKSRPKIKAYLSKPEKKVEAPKEEKKVTTETKF